MLHPFQINPQLHVVPTYPETKKFIQDGMHPLNLIVIQWFIERATVFIKNYPTTLNPPVHLVIAKTDPTDAANKEVFRSLARHHIGDIPSIPKCRFAGVILYDFYVFKPK